MIETGAGARGVSILGNAGSGIVASGCHIVFQGPATIAENPWACCPCTAA